MCLTSPTEYSTWSDCRRLCLRSASSCRKQLLRQATHARTAPCPPSPPSPAPALLALPLGGQFCGWGQAWSPPPVRRGASTPRMLPPRAPASPPPPPAPAESPAGPSRAHRALSRWAQGRERKPDRCAAAQAAPAARCHAHTQAALSCVRAVVTAHTHRQHAHRHAHARTWPARGCAGRAGGRAGGWGQRHRVRALLRSVRRPVSRTAGRGQAGGGRGLPLPSARAGHDPPPAAAWTCTAPARA